MEYVFDHQRLISQNHHHLEYVVYLLFLVLLNFTLVHGSLPRHRESQKKSQSLREYISLTLHQTSSNCLSLCRFYVNLIVLKLQAIYQKLQLRIFHIGLKSLIKAAKLMFSQAKLTKIEHINHLMLWNWNCM